MKSWKRTWRHRAACSSGSSKYVLPNSRAPTRASTRSRGRQLSGGMQPPANENVRKREGSLAEGGQGEEEDHAEETREKSEDGDGEMRKVRLD
eukprot:2330078-Pyramimonas_sp.AAC.1